MAQMRSGGNSAELIIIFAAAAACALICLFALPALAELKVYDYHIIYAVIFAALSFLIALQIKKQYETIAMPPSFLVIIIFLIVPPIGTLGYNFIIKVIKTYLGGKLDFTYPAYIWYLGTLIFSLSLAFFHLFWRKTYSPPRHVWNFSALKGWMSVFVFISVLFTVLAVYKIGYIPIMKGNFDIDRFSYDLIAGEYTIKFSRLWLVVFVIAVHLYFLEHRRFYLLLMGLCAFCLVIYGNRTYLFIPLVYLFLFYAKRERLVALRMLVVIFLFAFALFSFIYQIRMERVVEFKSLSPVERSISFMFGEWKEFSYVINDFEKTKAPYLKEKIFLGVISPIFPKQVWQLFGIDKSAMYSYNAAEYFGRYFSHYAGVRIGIIGECYVGFGMPGVAMIMALLGMIFSFLENRYLILDKDDPAFMLVSFILSIIFFLPLLTFIAITTTIVFFGFFAVLLMFFCQREIVR